MSALSRPDVNLIVVVTDGVPTQGQTNRKKLARQIARLNTLRARIFSVGLVGKDPFGKDRTFQAASLIGQISRESNGEFRLFPLG